MTGDSITLFLVSDVQQHHLTEANSVGDAIAILTRAAKVAKEIEEEVLRTIARRPGLGLESSCSQDFERKRKK